VFHAAGEGRARDPQAFRRSSEAASRRQAKFYYVPGRCDVGVQACWRERVFRASISAGTCGAFFERFCQQTVLQRLDVTRPSTGSGRELRFNPANSFDRAQSAARRKVIDLPADPTGAMPQIGGRTVKVIW